MADTEVEARWIALNGIQHEIKKRSKDNFTTFDTETDYQVEDFAGYYCKPINDMMKPIFRNPLADRNVYSPLIAFDEWIKSANCSEKVFEPKTIRVYSCLDG